METLSVIFYVSMAAWLLSEIIYKRKLTSGENDQKKDQSTLGILWIVIMLLIAIAVTVSHTFKFPVTEDVWIFFLGETLIILGIIFRLMIIRSLGKYFTVDVTIRQDHKIKKEGCYKYVRHPSYSFSLLTFLGLGLYLNNWISLVVAFVPPFLAFLYRIKIEEKALTDQFGDEYLEYRRHTKKLIPFIF